MLVSASVSVQERARTAMDALWAQRNVQSDLLGTVLQVTRTGEWTNPTSTVGAGSDSYYEYLLKSHILLDDPVLLARFLRVFLSLLFFPLFLDHLDHLYPIRLATVKSIPNSK